jgi:penicillin-binding protein 1A
VRSILRLVLVILVTGGLLSGTVVAVSPYVHDLANANKSEDEDIDLNLLDSFAVRSYIYASDGSTLSTLHGEENRSPVTLDIVPGPVWESVLAVEDADFYNHGGVNLKANFRALIENVSAGDIEQGGSTITQQLVKNAILTSDQDFNRKSKEAAIAIRLEQKLAKIAEDNGAPDPTKVAKDNILGKYLNTVYFGSGAYGVQAAAETYYGKPVNELGWAEGAMLAALIRNPVGYDPTLHPEAAKKQRQIALDRLVHLGKITPKEGRDFGNAPIPSSRCKVDDSASKNCGSLDLPQEQSYFAEEVKQAMLWDPEFNLGATYSERYKSVFSGGLKVYTTYDPQAQAAAEQTVRNILDKSGAPKQNVTAAMVGIEPSTGAVRVMVGGPGIAEFKYNLTTRQRDENGNFIASGRQTGSSFKTFVLLTALEQGNVPNDTIGGGGHFKNPGGEKPFYDVGGNGGTLTSVTQASSNGAFVRLGAVVGLDHVVDLARRLGITGRLDPYLNMPLGTNETTPIEMASAYSAIPNGGVHEPYYYIDKIEDRAGKVLYQHELAGTRAISQQTACLATQILAANVTGGTGTRARLNRQQAAGKTGTTDKGTDVWFVGYTPYLTTAVWMGNPSPKEGEPPPNVIGGAANFGGTWPATIWHDFNTSYHESRPPIDFPRCQNTRGGRLVKGLGDARNVGGAAGDGDFNGNNGNTGNNGNRTGR